MAEIISPILSVVSLICSCSGRNICYLFDLKENQDALKNAMEELKNIRDDVMRQIDDAETDPNERRQRTHEVNGWLERVHTIEGKVVDILQKVDKQIAGRCGGYCPKSCWSGYKLGKSVIQKLASVEELKSKGHFENLTYNLPPSKVQEMNVDPTVGMESMFEKVWRFINTDDVRSMGLYGQGGVGKTRLLKQINNEFLKTTHDFDVVILVVVSRVLNIEAIQKKIGERLGLLLQQNNKDETKRADEIFNVLRKKNFVLLLDDIWEKVDLQRIGVPRPDHNKSKIIFTTRSETVCGLMEANKKFKVECLPWDKAWSLFQEKVGNETLSSFAGVVELAKVVARQCGGLPLALITIGVAMSNKDSPDEWNKSITTLRTSASKFPGMGDTILPLLKLSYDNLDCEDIKSCFLYCSLFPEDYSIDKAQLINFWFVEGFLNDYDNIDEASNQGSDIIASLKAACLLESGVDEETHVKMHDSIRDLALWIANGCGSKMDQFFVSFNMSGSWKNAKRIFLMCDEYAKDLINVPEAPNLLTLLVHGNPPFLRDLGLAKEFFSFTRRLRVLDVSNSKMWELPTIITRLPELQHLGLSRTNVGALPSGLSNLVGLKCLDLSYTYNLKLIPPMLISGLSKLQVLNLHDSSFGHWEEYQPRLQELDGLKQLYDLRLTIQYYSALVALLCNQRLLTFTKGLTLNECRFLKSVSLSPSSSSSSSMNQNLGNLKCLKDLKLNRCADLEEFTIEDGFFSNLETLSLIGLRMLNMVSMKTPIAGQLVWSLHNLNKIVITDCHAFRDLKWLVYVGNLKRLFLYRCEGMEEIIADGFGGNNSSMMNGVFNRLKTIEMFNLPKLKSICRHSLAFPSLESMEVGYCPELKKLPFSDLSCKFNNTLQGIKGGTQWWNELQWEDENLKSKILPYFQEKPWE